jgi:hypothetical protein
LPFLLDRQKRRAQDFCIFLLYVVERSELVLPLFTRSPLHATRAMSTNAKVKRDGAVVKDHNEKPHGYEFLGP